MRRVLTAIAALISTLFLPWFVTALILVYGMLSFSFFFETLIIALIFDLWYGGAGTLSIPFSITVGTLFILLFVRFIKSHTRFSS
jgi:hypothetical protein